MALGVFDEVRDLPGGFGVDDTADTRPCVGLEEAAPVRNDSDIPAVQLGSAGAAGMGKFDKPAAA